MNVGMIICRSACRLLTPTSIALLFTGFLVVLGNGSALSDGAPLWQLALQQQLRSERDCELLSILHVRQYELAGSHVLEGRVACVDRREFDFSRPQLHSKFKIQLCLPTAC